MSTSSRTSTHSWSIPGPTGRVRAEDRGRHDVPAAGLRDDVAPRPRGGRACPPGSPTAAARRGSACRRRRPRSSPRPGTVAVDRDQERRVRSLDEAPDDLDLAVGRKGSAGGRQVDGGRQGWLDRLVGDGRLGRPGSPPRRGPARLAGHGRPSSRFVRTRRRRTRRSACGRLSARTRCGAGRGGRWDRAAGRRAGTAAARPATVRSDRSTNARAASGVRRTRTQVRAVGVVVGRVSTPRPRPRLLVLLSPRPPPRTCARASTTICRCCRPSRASSCRRGTPRRAARRAVRCRRRPGKSASGTRTPRRDELRERGAPSARRAPGPGPSRARPRRAQLPRCAWRKKVRLPGWPTVPVTNRSGRPKS